MSENTPGPPMRPAKKRERAAKRIWLTVVGRGGRSWDTWTEDPTGNGIVVTPPWSEHEEHFAVGESEGAYDITFDEEHGIRRLTVFEGMTKAPVHIAKGNWKEVGDMAAENQIFIENIEKEALAKLDSAEEPFPRWGIAIILMAVMTSAVAIASMVLG